MALSPVTEHSEPLSHVAWSSDATIQDTSHFHGGLSELLPHKTQQHNTMLGFGVRVGLICSTKIGIKSISKLLDTIYSNLNIQEIDIAESMWMLISKLKSSDTE